MSEDRFRRALGFALRWEGGFSDHKSDTGGRTMKGITERTYHAWLQKQGRSPADVRNITDGEVEEIYQDGYWKTARCPDLRPEIDVVQFDTAVNMGPNRSVRILQSAVGVTADGVFGPMSLAACKECDPSDAVSSYCDIREGLYRKFASRPGQHVFLKGWLNRLNDLRGFVSVPGYSATRSSPSEATPRILDLDANQPLEAWR